MNGHYEGDPDATMACCSLPTDLHCFLATRKFWTQINISPCSVKFARTRHGLRSVQFCGEDHSVLSSLHVEHACSCQLVVFSARLDHAETSHSLRPWLLLRLSNFVSPPLSNGPPCQPSPFAFEFVPSSCSSYYPPPYFPTFPKLKLPPPHLPLPSHPM
ncbi:uncharacterized protein EI90DRAFT_3049463, partial [Cantharellus anzutake]|uniref:uncharacterized protein n=1 Tax=Cantharellus anzutake TaxID=1750568 RepID=UPI0019077D2F